MRIAGIAESTCYKLEKMRRVRHLHCVKYVRNGSYSGPNFPAFGLNTRISPYSVGMWENADQNNSEYEHFLRSVLY